VLAAIDRAPTADTVAYDLYLRALDVERTQPVDSADRYARSRALLEQAVARDPSFELAHAALANVHITTYWWAFDLDPARRERTRQAAETALRLDPASAEAHLAYGTYFYYGFRDYERALAEYDIALARQPNSADILAFISFVKRRQGRWQEALDYLARAMSLDPHNPGYVRNQAETHFNIKQFAEADRVLDDWLRTHPDDVSMRRYRAYQIKDWRGDLDAVAEALAAIPVSIDPDHRITGSASTGSTLLPRKGGWMTPCSNCRPATAPGLPCRAPRAIRSRPGWPTCIRCSTSRTRHAPPIARQPI
jgi:tetratricopeptide (TPR) repeat protein